VATRHFFCSGCCFQHNTRVRLNTSSASCCHVPAVLQWCLVAWLRAWLLCSAWRQWAHHQASPRPGWSSQTAARWAGHVRGLCCCSCSACVLIADCLCSAVLLWCVRQDMHTAVYCSALCPGCSCGNCSIKPVAHGCWQQAAGSKANTTTNSSSSSSSRLPSLPGDAAQGQLLSAS
jgi:hypothetical protein